MREEFDIEVALLRTSVPHKQFLREQGYPRTTDFPDFKWLGKITPRWKKAFT